MKPFQFGKSKGITKKLDRAKPSGPSRNKFKEPKEPENPGVWNGVKIGSNQEWYVILALMKLKVDFDYQYVVDGGRNVRGGQVIDFIAYTRPAITPIYVQGDYWHRGSQAAEDALKQAQIYRIFKGQATEPLILWEHELQGSKMAFETVKERLFGYV